MKKLISKYIEDILIISGLTFIVVATFLWSKIVGYYSLGITLLALGIFFTRFPNRKG